MSSSRCTEELHVPQPKPARSRCCCPRNSSASCYRGPSRPQSSERLQHRGSTWPTRRAFRPLDRPRGSWTTTTRLSGMPSRRSTIIGHRLGHPRPGHRRRRFASGRSSTVVVQLRSEAGQTAEPDGRGDVPDGVGVPPDHRDRPLRSPLLRADQCRWNWSIDNESGDRRRDPTPSARWPRSSPTGASRMVAVQDLTLWPR